MKIELRVDGLEFKGEINKGNMEAQAMFSNLMGGVFTQQAVKAVEPIVVESPEVLEPPKVVESPKEEPEDNTTEDVEETYSFKDAVELAQVLAKDIVNDTPTKYPKYNNPVKDAKSKVESVSSHEPTGKRKLLVGTCECGERHFLWIYDNGKEHTFKCRNCGKEHKAEYNSPIRANINCSCCGNKAFAYTNSKKDVEVSCRQCESPIDLKYHEAHKCMESL